MPLRHLRLSPFFLRTLGYAVSCCCLLALSPSARTHGFADAKGFFLAQTGHNRGTSSDTRAIPFDVKPDWCGRWLPIAGRKSGQFPGQPGTITGTELAGQSADPLDLSSKSIADAQFCPPNVSAYPVHHSCPGICPTQDFRLKLKTPAGNPGAPS